MTKFAFIFPGQGSQFIGMGKDLAEAFPAAKAVFQEVDEALGQDLSGLMWAGSEDELKLTSNTQPALMAVSVAAMRALEEAHGIGADRAAFIAGHSLGEYSALASARSISVGDCARVLRIRGNAMQAAVPAGEGAMAALLGASPEQAAALCEAGAPEGVCEMANDNAPGQIVISGSKPAVELAISGAKEAGVKKAVLLPVSAPFHCSLMQPAADAMAEALSGIEISAPSAPLVANVTATAGTDADAIRKQLVEQVTGQVRWTESVQYMAGEGVELMIEAGAGKVLSVMNRRTVKGLEGLTMGTPEEIHAVAERLNG
ncbi:ACP S-malonyltransferase [Hyphomonas sp. FCG-A18]|uniref:ACP S-malonyltransferase n=1 Tax=Hyphomonas sp. FCG-A18 TaxID=3080019 RepID=UPI002B2C596D|nr:ACP S-malonyltransferase [Hyphomonas sp. FCG-A18]